jgi:hypothetical protein
MKKFMNSFMKTIAKQSMSSHAPFWSVMNFARDLNRKLNTHRIAAKSVLWLLRNNQKQWHINVCLALWEKANEDQTFTLISMIIMGDKGWIYSYNPDTKQQSSQWKSPLSPWAKTVWQVHSSTNSMLTVFIFFQCEGDCSPWICSS